MANKYNIFTLMKGFNPSTSRYGELALSSNFTRANSTRSHICDLVASTGRKPFLFHSWCWDLPSPLFPRMPSFEESIMVSLGCIYRR